VHGHLLELLAIQDLAASNPKHVAGSKKQSTAFAETSE
jgi:hypothetical protein